MAQIGELGVLLSGPSAGSLEWVGEPGARPEAIVVVGCVAAREGRGSSMDFAVAVP